MSDFINTIDALGDDAVIDSIISGTIEEFVDDVIATVGNYAFYGCSELKTLDLPNATRINQRAVQKCPKIENVNLPNVTYLDRECLSDTATTGVVSTIVFPNLTGKSNYVAQNAFKYKNLVFPKLKEAGYFYPAAKRLYFPALENVRAYIGARHYTKAIVFSNTEKMSPMVIAGSFDGTPIYNIYGDTSDGYIFVPRKFLSDDDITMDYRRATNWSKYANKIYPVEDFTVDGTTTGDIATIRKVTNSLKYVTNSNTRPIVGSFYNATLTPEGEFTISSVTITMGGVDVTEDVYNEETGEINIPAVTGDISITASCVSYKITNKLSDVSTNNITTVTAPNTSYYAVLTPTGSDPITSVKITMGGVDVTDDVYNTETGEINIPAVTGDIMINASCTVANILSYEVIQGYPASGKVNDTFTTPTGNGATTVYCPVTPGSIIRVSMTEKTTNRFGIGFAKTPLANGVALYHPFTADNAALEKTFTVPDGYTYLMVYLGVTPYPAVEPGFIIEDITEAISGPYLISIFTTFVTNTTIGGWTIGANRMAADIRNMSFSVGDTFTIGDYSTYEFIVGRIGGTDWATGNWGSHYGDYTITEATIGKMELFYVKRIDGANVTQADLDWIRANARVIPAT